MKFCQNVLTRPDEFEGLRETMNPCITNLHFGELWSRWYLHQRIQEIAMGESPTKSRFSAQLALNEPSGSWWDWTTPFLAH